jgi:hypothetical protein
VFGGDAISDVLAWPALRRTSNGGTVPRHLQSEHAQSETPHHYSSDVLSDRSWGFLANI